MSKLIKQLHQILEIAAPPLGFKTAAILPSRLMLLIGALPPGNANRVAQLTKAEVDAILIHSQDLKSDLPTLQQVASNAGDIPWGVWLEAMTEEGVKELKGMGADFLIFVASKAPATLLQEEIGKVMKVALPCDDGLIRTIDQLPIDTVLLDFRDKGENLTISQLMNCQWLAGSIGKPLLVAIQQELTDKEIQALWEAGVNGVVVEVREKTQQRLVKLCQAVKTLPPVTRKPRERRVVLPRLGEEAGSVTPEEI